MAGDVHECGSSVTEVGSRRVWVDTRRGPDCLPRLRGHCPPRACHPVKPPHCIPKECAPLPSEFRRNCPIPFAKHLERFNREYGDLPIFPPEFQSEPTDRSVERPERVDPELSRLAEQQSPHVEQPELSRAKPTASTALRLGDLPPLETMRFERRLRVTYRIDLPLRQGRVIDVLV